MAMIHEVRKVLKKCGVSGFNLKTGYCSKKDDRYSFDTAIEINGEASVIKDSVETLKVYGFDSHYCCMGYSADGTEYGQGFVRVVE